MKHAQGHFSLLIFQRCLVCSSQEEEGVRSSCYPTFLANLLLTIKEHALSPSCLSSLKLFAVIPVLFPEARVFLSTAQQRAMLFWKKGCQRLTDTCGAPGAWEVLISPSAWQADGDETRQVLYRASQAHTLAAYTYCMGSRGAKGGHTPMVKRRGWTPRWWCCWWGEGLASLRAALQLWGLCIWAGSLVRAMAIFKAFSSLGNFCIIM